MSPNSISYEAFLTWAKVKTNQGLLILLAAYIRELAAAAETRHRWRLLKQIGEAVVPAGHLEGMLGASLVEIDLDVEVEQAAVLKAVNATIDTGAKVEREVRDEAWLRTVHASLNSLIRIVDDGVPTSFYDPAPKLPAVA